MTNFRRAFAETKKILQMPAETHDSGAPSPEVQLHAIKAVINKLVGADALDAYTASLMGFYNAELRKIKASIQANSSKDYVGELSAGATSINVGATLYKPALYLDGVRIDKNGFRFSGTTITLTEPYSKKYNVVWYVEDTGVPAARAFEPMSLFALPNEEEISNELELSHIFTDSNLEWNLGADISNYKRINLLIEDTVIDITTKLFIKNKTINAKVISIENDGASYKEYVLVLELINNNTIWIKSIYDDTKQKVNSLPKELKCEIVLEK